MEQLTRLWKGEPQFLEGEPKVKKEEKAIARRPRRVKKEEEPQPEQVPEVKMVPQVEEMVEENEPRQLEELIEEIEADEKQSIKKRKRNKKKKNNNNKEADQVIDQTNERIEDESKAKADTTATAKALANEKLTLDQACKEDRRIVEEFVCPICTCVATEDMVRCAEDCEGTYCRDCITQWMKKSDKCPLCSQTFREEKVQRKYLNLLKHSKFNCTVPGCDVMFSYEDKSKHYLNDCKAGCGIDLGTRSTKEQVSTACSSQEQKC